MAGKDQDGDEDRDDPPLRLLPEAPGEVMLKFKTQSEREHAAVLMECMALFSERNAKYQDNWRHQGMRGNLFKLRWKIERAWQALWHSDDVEGADHDDVLDAINYAVCVVRCARDNDRDGMWFW